MPDQQGLIHCWESVVDDAFPMGGTCLLPDGHDGPHEYTADNQITVAFPPMPSVGALLGFDDAEEHPK